MDFRDATDMLFARVDHEDLAQALGVSIAAIRQARLKPEATAHRAPPANWRRAVESLAERRISQYERLLRTLREEGEASSTGQTARANRHPKNS